MDAAAPYAEYWFGTHPSGPSSLAASGELLASFLARSPAVLGVPPYAGARSPLPYLLKVLSVAKALSVQAHPDRARAAALHAANAREYADANHKPELAVALTPFQAMCGFRPREELARLVAGTPELAALVGPAPLAALRAAAAQAPAEPFRAALRTAFGAYMRAPAADVAAAAAALGERLAAAEAAGELLPPLSPDAVALRLARAFPGDIGVFAPYWLNLLALAPGEAVFLPANEPHAYLAGDAVEVMAASDNVVRAGLTPKFRDVDTLVDMLSYADGAVRVLAPAAGGGEGGAEGGGGPNNSASGGAAVYTYAPPVPEFVLRRLVVPPGGAARVPPGASAATLVVVAGAGALALDGAPDAERAVAVAEGGVWLLRAGRGATLSAPAGAGDALVAFVAAAADAT